MAGAIDVTTQIEEQLYTRLLRWCLFRRNLRGILLTRAGYRSAPAQAGCMVLDRGGGPLLLGHVLIGVRRDVSILAVYLVLFGHLFSTADMEFAAAHGQPGRAGPCDQLSDIQFREWPNAGQPFPPWVATPSMKSAGRTRRAVA